MKRIWVILLSISLLAVLCTSVPAAMTVKFSGEYYAAGLYLDKTTLNKTDVAGQSKDLSTAFFYQRLRVRTDFVMFPGLTLTTRFDAMERAWGAARSAPGVALDSSSYGTAAENENIAFDWAFVSYKSPFGIFDVGVMNTGPIGGVFGDSSAPNGRIKYVYASGPLTINLKYTKVKDNSRSSKNPITFTDADNDNYAMEVQYQWKQVLAWLSVYQYRYAENRPTLNNKKSYTLITPYTSAKIGPVALLAEFNYARGKENEFDSNAGLPDIDMQNISAWTDATADFGMFYFGGAAAYVSGDDPGTGDKREGGTLSGGIDWNPCLIMWNYDRTYWAGNIDGYNNARQSSPMSNAWFFQVRGGVKPVDGLDIMASVSYANADKKPTAAWKNNSYGYEVDLTAVYKISNNLSYMLGGGYLFTGDYYKGESDANSIRDNYLLINKLTLTF